jgi:hypothetical protein
MSNSVCTGYRLASGESVAEYTARGQQSRLANKCDTRESAAPQQMRPILQATTTCIQLQIGKVRQHQRGTLQATVPSRCVGGATLLPSRIREKSAMDVRVLYNVEDCPCRTFS